MNNPRLIRKKLSFLYSKKSIDYRHNIYALSKMIDIDQDIEETLQRINFSIENVTQSWHYAIIKIFSLKRNFKKILEIGTFKGEFTFFLAELFPNSNITSIDLSHEDDRFKDSYYRRNKLDAFLTSRSKNLQNENIEFIVMDSYNLIEEFWEKNRFDLIWIDGDHLNPQVTIDIISSLKLLSTDGIIMIDDVMKTSHKDNYVSNESYKFLMDLKRSGIVDFQLIIKRITNFNFYQKKYIAVVKKLK